MRRNRRFSRGYKLISDKKRHMLIDLIQKQNMKIIDAAEIMDIPYENAKAIFRIYKQEGRTTKKGYKKKTIGEDTMPRNIMQEHDTHFIKGAPENKIL